MYLGVCIDFPSEIILVQMSFQKKFSQQKWKTWTNWKILSISLPYC